MASLQRHPGPHHLLGAKHQLRPAHQKQLFTIRINLFPSQITVHHKVQSSAVCSLGPAFAQSSGFSPWTWPGMKGNVDFCLWGIICWAISTSPCSSLERNWIKYDKDWWTVLENASRPSDIHLEGSTVHTLVLLYHIIDALGQLWGSHFKVGLAGFFLITSHHF